jgi:Abnormal spindle-like microcephaly-assoc'd, ASPM-SPD-2-Hydin
VKFLQSDVLPGPSLLRRLFWTLFDVMRRLVPRTREIVAIILLGILCVAFANASDQLRCTPRYLNFGSVVVGQSKTLAVTMSNTGSTSLTVATMNKSAPWFSVTHLTLPLTLPAGRSVTFNVSFVPKNIGTAAGSVLFTSNVSAVRVYVSGAGVAGHSMVASPSSIGFGSVPIGSSLIKSETLTNSSASSSVTISQASVTGTGFRIGGLSLPLTLAPGHSVSFSVKFAPQSSGSVSGKVSILSNAANPALYVPLAGTGTTSGQLSANPSSLSFGNVIAGSSKNISETIANTGSSAVTLSQTTASGNGFSISGVSLPVTLGGGQSATFTVTFAPKATGAVGGTLLISSNASTGTLSVPLSGTGTSPGQLALTPSNLSFGNVAVGSAQSQTGALTASNGPVIVSSGTVSGSEFHVSGITLPTTIPAGTTISFKVTFAPQMSGSTSGKVSFFSNASNSPSIEAVTGSGMPAPQQHSVTLSWNPSTSSGVIGYYVYRAGVSGGPYSRITSLDPSTTYVDTSVQSGNTYYYVVTSANGSGQQSSYSAQVGAVIP